MGSTQSTWGVLTQRSPKMTRPLWTSLALLLLAALSHAEDYTCPAGKSKETITLAVGESVDFSTQENDAYGKNVKCVVKFKRGKRSKCKLNFSCSAFTLTAKNSNCNKGSDFMKIGKEKFCEDNSPDVTVNGRTLNVLFRSNKKSKGGSGAKCTASCIDTSAPATTTTAPPATTAAPTTTGFGSNSGSGSSSGFGSGSGSGCVDCLTIDGINGTCQFPFFVNGKEYSTCTMDYTAPGETPWCATKVDGLGNLLHLQSPSWGYCESTCPTDTDDSTTVACPHSDPAFPEECAARHSNTHKKVLFLGNSYTGGCNGIDGVVRQIAEGAGFSATTERSSPGGKTLNWHAANSLNRIKNGDWDAVVLQDQSQRPSFGASYVYSNIIPDVLTLVQTMRETNVCTLPVFFQTWGKRDGDTQNCSPAPWDALCTFDGVQDQLTEAYSTMAYVSQPSKVAPAGEAWRTYANRNSLFANDGSHATCSGTFLAACTIFQQIWGVPCSASSYSPVGDAAALKDQADAIVAAGSWSFPSNGPPCPGCVGMGR